MNDDLAFLRTIQTTPQDTVTRLVYADWLEERGDPRGELVRIEAEMRQLPVFSDRYWLLKPRRNELRTRAPADWLEAMRYGTDCQPMFGHGVPAGWKERWRLIREFVDRWHRYSLGDVGGRGDEVRATEARLGRTLPPSAREWVAIAGDLHAPHAPGVIRDGYQQLRELEGHSAIYLLLQAQGVYHWAVHHEDLALPDPPVYGFHPDWDNGEERTFVPDDRNPVAPSVTAFAFGYMMGDTDGGRGGFSTDVADPEQLIHDVLAALPVHARFGQMELFESENILVQLGPSVWTLDSRIDVKVGKPLPRETIPAFLWNYAHNGGAFHGMFAPDTVRGGDARSSFQETDEGDEIPF